MRKRTLSNRANAQKIQKISYSESCAKYAGEEHKERRRSTNYNDEDSNLLLKDITLKIEFLMLTANSFRLLWVYPNGRSLT